MLIGDTLFQAFSVIRNMSLVPYSLDIAALPKNSQGQHSSGKAESRINSLS